MFSSYLFFDWFIYSGEVFGGSVRVIDLPTPEIKRGLEETFYIRHQIVELIDR